MYEDIRPYDDFQTSEALKRVASNPLVDKISEFLYPGSDAALLRELLSSINGVDDFQNRVMYNAIGSIIVKTSDGLTFGGLEYFKNDDGSFNHYLLLSNHRDIVLDPAIIQYILKGNNLPLTEIAVGDNLISSPFVEDLMRSNRMIKVIRSGSVRELYAASKNLSEYMRMRLLQGSSIWIANRNGRTKNGYDETSQGILKMFSMSGPAGFVDNFSELHIMPVAISYEIEPCGLEKALETCIKEKYGEYHKAAGEDLKSILTGIIQKKGRIHIEFCKPLTIDEINDAASYGKNDNLRRLCEIIDDRILNGYRLWPTNLAAAGEDVEQCDESRFNTVIESSMSGLQSLLANISRVTDSNGNNIELEVDCAQVKDIFKSIYATPARRILSKKS